MRALGLVAGAAALALAVSGCGGSAEKGQTHSSNGKAGLDGAPLPGLRAAMPAKADFPDGWKVQAQPTPPATLPGFNGTNTQISSVTPAGCLDFVAGFISAPGSSIPGEFIATVTAQIPAPESGTITVLALRKTRNWESPAKLRDSLRDCAQVQTSLAFGGNANSTTFLSSPIDSTAIKAEAAGRATAIHSGEASASIAVVSAQTRGVLVVATAETRSGDDQRALLVKLIGQTVDKLNNL